MIESAAERDPRLGAELAEDETLVWAAAPVPRALGRHRRGLRILGVIFVVFTGVWLWIFLSPWRGFSAVSPVAWVGIVLFGGPSVALGVLLILSPWFAARSAHRYLYALTDRRCVVWKPVFGGAERVSSYTPGELIKMKLRPYRDGTGDLILKVERVKRRPNQPGSDFKEIEHAFYGIDHAEEVERLVRATL